MRAGKWAGRVGIALSLCLCAVSSTAFAQGGRPYGSRLEGKTAVDRAIGKCVGAVIGGAILGAIAGRVVSRNGTGKGALLGAGVGGVACAVMVSMAGKKDKARIRALQLEALNTGRSQSDSWQTDKGETAVATATVAPIRQISAPTSGEALRCTTVQMSVSTSAKGGQFQDIACLVGDTWLTGDKLKPYGLNGDKTI